MVSPTQRRSGVVWAREAYRLPERRACRAMGTSRSTVRYKSVRPPREPLRARLREVGSGAGELPATGGCISCYGVRVGG